jgi:hypothetical protein
VFDERSAPRARHFPASYFPVMSEGSLNRSHIRVLRSCSFFAISALRVFRDSPHQNRRRRHNTPVPQTVPEEFVPNPWPRPEPRTLYPAFVPVHHSSFSIHTFASPLHDEKTPSTPVPHPPSLHPADSHFHPLCAPRNYEKNRLHFHDFQQNARLTKSARKKCFSHPCFLREKGGFCADPTNGTLKFSQCILGKKSPRRKNSLAPEVGFIRHRPANHHHHSHFVIQNFSWKIHPSSFSYPPVFGRDRIDANRLVTGFPPAPEIAMTPKARSRLFGIGALAGAVLALLLWQAFTRLNWWQIAALLFALWMGSGMLWVILIRRQGRG